MDIDDDYCSGDSDGEVFDIDMIDGKKVEVITDPLHKRVYDADLVVAAKTKNHVVLTEQEIHQRLSEEVAATAEVFCVPTDWALALLGHYRWNPLRLHEEWFVEQDRIRDAVGLGDTAVAAAGRDEDEETVTCGICAEAKPAASMASAGCAHRYCRGCWRGYVAAALDGGRCLALRCPDASCSRAVLRGTVERFATGAGRGAYARLLARAYLDARRQWLKPCTAAGCGCAIELSRSSSSGDSDLACRCGNAFCWRCGGAPHWPASCAAVARWAREADAASADWLLLHTKQCPMCQRRIERVDGCDDVECVAPCWHRFCWGCLAPAANHWDLGVCLRRQTAETEAEQLRARLALDRFLHYQDLWMDNLRKRRNAERELGKVRAERLPLAMGEMEKQASLGIVELAWEQVAEGRRVLGNACAHGQSLRDAGAARWELFEFQHRQTDAMLEKLQERAAKGKQKGEDLEAFSAELETMTKLTRHGVENFTKAVEEGAACLIEALAPASSTST